MIRNKSDLKPKQMLPRQMINDVNEKLRDYSNAKLSRKRNFRNLNITIPFLAAKFENVTNISFSGFSG